MDSLEKIVPAVRPEWYGKTGDNYQEQETYVKDDNESEEVTKIVQHIILFLSINNPEDMIGIYDSLRNKKQKELGQALKECGTVKYVSECFRKSKDEEKGEFLNDLYIIHKPQQPQEESEEE